MGRSTSARRRGQARLGRPRHGADRVGHPPRRDLDRLRDERVRGLGREPARRAGVPDPLALGGRVPGAPGRERPGRLRRLLQRLRQPDAVVHPALPLGPLERTRHPARGDRRFRLRLQERQRGPRAGGGGGARGHPRAGRDGPRLPPLHAPRGRPRGAAGRLPASLHPHPLDPVGLLARASRADPRGDLRGASGKRHHRLPHPLLQAQLPAVLSGPDGSGRRLRAGPRAVRGARGLGQGLSAADRPPGHPPGRRERAYTPSSSSSCCAAGATS